MNRNNVDNSEIKTLNDAIELQIKINDFLKTKEIKDLVGDYGELLIAETFPGTPQSFVNQGYDFMSKKYGRIEVKTRRQKKGSTETRAVGFSGKLDGDGGFDTLAHIILNENFEVQEACLVKYDDILDEIKLRKGKVSYKFSSTQASKEIITDKLQETQKRINIK